MRGARPDGSALDGAAARATLPPPEWMARKADPKLYLAAPAPIVRRTDKGPALRGGLRAELLSAHASGDTARERLAAARLARWLASHGQSWDEAVRYARLSLEIEDDESLRHELAGWLEGLGDSAGAADALQSLADGSTRDPADAVRLLLRIGVLEARAGNARGAALSFGRAARLDPGEALASELLGTLGSWAPSAVSPAEAADSYVDAAERRLASRALDAQMEDLLRAFDVDPTSSVAVAALATALGERGRPLGADEVWRAHASALKPSDDKRSRAVHARRRLQARAAGDLARALGAALDEGLDGSFGAEVGDFMDDLLLRAGLLEPLVARLEIRAESAPRATRAALLEEIARLYAGPLANADRAAAARILALQADPTREDALSALRVHATETRDATDLVEALIRAIAAPDGAVSTTVRLSITTALVVIADESLGDPVLAAWALAKSGGDAQARDAASVEALRVAESEKGRFVRALAHASPNTEERVEALKGLAGLLRSCPDEGELNAEVLRELVAALPLERRWYVEAVRLAFRRGDMTEAISLARGVREGGAPGQDVVEATITEAVARRALQDFSGANETTRGLLVRAPDNPRALAVAWMNAALAGDHETRSGALEQLANFAGASVRAVLLAVAAETRAAIGDRDASRRIAERACHTDPSSARAVGTLADAATGAHDWTAASALERGIHFLFARSAWCRALAEALDAMGEASYAVGWTQRLVALRPGDRKAMGALLERVARTHDGSRLAEALIWVVSQPQPQSALADLVVTPLRDLIAVDAERAVLVARRALDAFGGRLVGLRDAMLAAADAAGDEAFAVTVLERTIAAEDAPGQVNLLAQLRERQQRMGDADGEARSLLLLARAAPEDDLLPALESLAGYGLSPDAELARLEALAHLAAHRGDRAAMVEAWRDLGGALWDVAGDRVGARRAFWRAAKLDSSAGFMTLGFDLAQFGGTTYALNSLQDRIEQEPNDSRAAGMAAQTSRVALALGEPSRALDFAMGALLRNARLSEALEIAEVAATASNREVELTRVYDDLTARALGRFARRAVNYRGARYFEQHGDHGLALKHAAVAFQAVPSEGASLILLIRTAERAGDRAQAVRALVQVAEITRDTGARFAWLMRAAETAGRDEEGLALRVDVLLHALTVSRDPRASAALEETALELLRRAPDERASLEVRLERASRTVTAKASGPEGARLSVSFARMALEIFDDAHWAVRALKSAFTADADVEDYEAIVPRATDLAEVPAVAELFQLVSGPYANVGVSAYRLLARVSEALGDGPRSADYWSRAATRDPEDQTLLRIADVALRANGDEDGWSRLRKAAPDAERARAFHAFAEERTKEGAVEEALKALERAVELASPEDKPGFAQELRVAYEASGRAERIEERALREAMAEEASATVRAEHWAEVGHLREGRGDLKGSIEALLRAAKLDGSSVGRWSAIERIAHAAGMDDVRLDAIREMSERVPPSARLSVLKRLARAHEDRDDFRQAEATWRHIAEADPDDEEADHAIEALISALRDYDNLALHLERRATRLSKLPGAREALRAVRLRRAAILEQRLGRTRDACAELTLVLDEAPDNVSALSYLADLHERLGEFGRAAPIWKRVALLSRDPAMQGETELRGARAALAAEDYRGALVAAKDVLLREPGRRDAIELRASAARSLRDDEELGEALEELALATTDDSLLQSDALMEASYAAIRAGRNHAGLERARRAAEVAPDRAATQLLARSLEYRLRGTGTRDEARATLGELDAVTGDLSREELATQAFLRAEALDAISGEGAPTGVSVLQECAAKIGTHPLLSLGMAERLLALGDFTGALPEFESALSGELGDFRDRGRVALTAAEAAIRAGRDIAALAHLQDAAASAATRTTALLRAAQLVLTGGDGARARSILSELASSSDGDDRAKALAQLSRVERESSDAVERARASQTFDSAVAAASPGGGLAAQLLLERDSLNRAAKEALEIRAPADPRVCARRAHVVATSRERPAAGLRLRDRPGARAGDVSPRRLVASSRVRGRGHRALRPRESSRRRHDA